MDQKFDIFLACAPKDYNKLPFVAAQIEKHVIGFDKVFICSPTKIPTWVLAKIPLMFYEFRDKDLLPYDRSLWKYRPNWCFQQHLKLFQNVTQDMYMTIDCDILINRPMKFFDQNNKPIWYKGLEQIYPPYFTFMGFMIDVPRLGHTFIADMNLFYRPIITEMLERNHFKNVEAFITKSQQITNKYCHIGEPELYGNYCLKYWPDFYSEAMLKQAPIQGRSQKDSEENVYTDAEIQKLLDEYKHQDYDTISLHSWLDEGDQI